MKKKNLLLEILEKPFLVSQVEPEYLSSTPSPEQIEQSLEDIIPVGFLDTGDTNIYSGQASKKQKQTHLQNELINTYRKIAGTAEVSDAINEIVDEAIFSPGSNDIINMDFNTELPQEVKDKFAVELKEITNKIKLNKNIYSMFLSFYIDGQLNVHCAYDEKDLGGGIKKLSILTPFNLIFNYTKDIWEYVDLSHQNNQFITKDQQKERYFDREEVIRIDSGIYNDNVILGNLHTAIKPANMLSTLEDMLIPMRFTRSVSRRVFNVDVSNLNNKKAEEVMKANQSKFKYKKFYDLNTGTISNQQHISSLTEDYWFPNRGGEKGTTVDTIDETGNLGELGDVLYFKRKLYTSLKVPVNRINDEGPAEGEFDWDTSSVNREEMKFFNFISRLRNQFLELFYELLRRQVIVKGIATDEEWNNLLPLIKIKFVAENSFFEKMEREKLSEQINQYNDIEELIGKYFSHEFVLKKVFKMSDEEISELSEQLKTEKTNPIYARFYNEDEDGDGEDW
jgi:hypothetical protein